MAGLINFNRFINVTLLGKDGTFIINTPMYGRKPEVELHGMLMASDFAKDFEVRVINLYSEVDLSLFNRINVSAGYFNKPELFIEGSISVLYTEQPGPDRVTVIKCFIGNVEQILNATCDIKMPAGSTLQVILKTLTDAINQALVPGTTNTMPTRWKDPNIEPSVAGLVCGSPLSHNGSVKDLFPLLKQIFPTVDIVFGNNQLVAFDPKLPPTKGNIVMIKHLMSPVSYTAGHAVVTAPWEPSLKPGDLMFIPPQFRTMGVKEATATQIKELKPIWRVISVQFDFSTTGSQNKMIVTGA